MESDVDICLWTEPTGSNRPHPRLNSFTSATCRSSTVNNLTHLTMTVDPLVLLLAPTLPLMHLPPLIAPATTQGSQQFHEPSPTPDLPAA